jgi:hypothetical protein
MNYAADSGVILGTDILVVGDFGNRYCDSGVIFGTCFGIG